MRSSWSSSTGGRARRCMHTFQTNGILLDDEWCEFFKRARLPGRPQRRRPARDPRHATGSTDSGRGTFDRVMRRWRLLRKHRRRVQHPVHRERGERAPRANGLPFFRDELGAKWVQFIPIVERATRGHAADRQPGVERAAGPQATAVHADRQPGHRALGRRRAVRPVPDRRVRGVGAPRRGHGVRAAVRRDARGVLRSTPAVHPRADLRVRAGARTQRRPLQLRSLRRAGLPARQHPRHAHGRADRVKPKQRQFGQDKRDTLTAQCRDCKVRHLCNGGCPKDRFSLSRDGEPGHNYLCAGLELFFMHTGPAFSAMAQLLQRDLSPSRCDGRPWWPRTSAGGRTRRVRAAAARSSGSATVRRRRRSPFSKVSV